MCACRALKARSKTLAGAFIHAPARRARLQSPPGLNKQNKMEIQWRTFSFFLHMYATVLTHWYLIGLIITFG
jgi:hypothetical protein